MIKKPISKDLTRFNVSKFQNIDDDYEEWDFKKQKSNKWVGIFYFYFFPVFTFMGKVGIKENFKGAAIEISKFNECCLEKRGGKKENRTTLW